MQHLSDINYEGWSAQRLKVEQLTHPLSDQFSATQHTAKLSPMKVFKSLTVFLWLCERFNKKKILRGFSNFTRQQQWIIWRQVNGGKLCWLSNNLPKIKISHRKKDFRIFRSSWCGEVRRLAFFAFNSISFDKFEFFLYLFRHSPVAAWANEPIFYIFDTQPHARLFHYSHQKERECRARPRS